MACLCSLPACYLVTLYVIIAMAYASVQHRITGVAGFFKPITLRLTHFWEVVMTITKPT